MNVDQAEQISKEDLFDTDDGSHLNLTREEYESLKALRSSPHWAVYRKFLIKTKNALMISTMAGTDPYKIMKGVGMAAGVNLAINQITIIVEQGEAKAKKLEEQALKKSNGKKPAQGQV